MLSHHRQRARHDDSSQITIIPILSADTTNTSFHFELQNQELKISQPVLTNSAI